RIPWHPTLMIAKSWTVIVVCGILGTIGGGFVLDYIKSTISNAFKLLSVTSFFGAIFCFCAFLFKKEMGFIIFFAVGELLVFATQAPVNFVCLHCVEPSVRPLSMAMSTVAIHIFGDVPSSPLVGVLQGSSYIALTNFMKISVNRVAETKKANTTPLLETKTDEEVATSLRDR
ncbi:putative sphingolipid transporter spinster homolog 2, partial [Drosera capensis]